MTRRNEGNKREEEEENKSRNEDIKNNSKECICRGEQPERGKYWRGV